MRIDVFTTTFTVRKLKTMPSGKPRRGLAREATSQLLLWAGLSLEQARSSLRHEWLEAAQWTVGKPEDEHAVAEFAEWAGKMFDRAYADAGGDAALDGVAIEEDDAAGTTALMPTMDMLEHLRISRFPELTPQAFETFVRLVESHGLSLQSDVYPYVDRETGVVTVGLRIAGFRELAERCPEYGGLHSQMWLWHDGEWRDHFLPTTDHPYPKACRTLLTRRDRIEKITAVAHWDEHCKMELTPFGTLEPMPHWREKPAHMLAIASEQVAYRLGIPAARGIYSPEEMRQQRVVAPDTAASASRDADDFPMIEDEEEGERAFEDLGFAKGPALTAIVSKYAKVWPALYRDRNKTRFYSKLLDTLRKLATVGGDDARVVPA